jgi:hypothetical protein
MDKHLIDPITAFLQHVEQFACRSAIKIAH